MRLFKRRFEPESQGPLFQEVHEAMKSVQAYAKSHGGAIELISVDTEGNVKIRFRGACAFCPMADITLKLGIEKQLRALVPGVGKIRQV